MLQWFGSLALLLDLQTVDGIDDVVLTIKKKKKNYVRTMYTFSSFCQANSRSLCIYVQARSQILKLK